MDEVIRYLKMNESPIVPHSLESGRGLARGSVRTNGGQARGPKANATRVHA